MPEAPLRIAVITGSTREGRFGPIPARWIAARVDERPDMLVDPIDLAHAGLRPIHPQALDPDEQLYVERIGRADGFVVVTPEYNHAYPAGLKHAIDLPRDEWRQKPVAFVSYGGLAGGLRAVEQLRLVFAELHATTVRDTVSFHNFYGCFDDAGQPLDRTGTTAAATTMLDQLAWWATALRTAREHDQFAGEAA